MKFANQLNPPDVVFDSTDHFSFECPNYGCNLNITGTSEVLVSEQKCTRFFLQCPMCKGTTYRKIYWGKP